MQCHAPSVIIRTVAAEDISPSITQAELAVESDLQPAELVEPPTSLETEAFPDEIHPPKLAVEEPPTYSEGSSSSKFGSSNSTELIDRVMATAEDGILETDLKREEAGCPADLGATYPSEVRKSIAICGNPRRA